MPIRDARMPNGGTRPMTLAGPGKKALGPSTVLLKVGIEPAMTITEFLTRCLDEDEAWARAASEAPWHVGDAYGLPRLEATGRAVGLTGADQPDLDHIARHDPARVLREVEAKRRVLTEWQKNEERIQENARQRDELTLAVRRDHHAIKRSMTLGWQLHGRREALGVALVSMANTYSDQPGWSRSWRLDRPRPTRRRSRSRNEVSQPS